LPWTPTPQPLRTRRRHTGALKCTQRREKKAAKGKVWDLETPLERAEMHAEAFAQVTGVLILLERELRSGAWSAGPRSAGVPRSAPCPHRRFALRFCSLPVIAQRLRFLGAPLGDARFAPLSNFRYCQVIENQAFSHAPARSGSTLATATLSNPHSSNGADTQRSQVVYYPTCSPIPAAAQHPRRRRAPRNSATLVDV